MTADPRASASPSLRRSLALAWPALVILACALVPFVGKAFTIDDNFFMFMAEHALADPLHPTAFTFVWGIEPTRANLASGPVMAWLLIPSAMAGGSEALAHLAQMVMFGVAIVFTVALASRVGLDDARARLAGLLLAATPAALAMAGTAMPDVPAMALGIVGLERLVAWRDEARPHQAVAATLGLALAPLARPHLLLMLGAGALLLHGVFGPRRGDAPARAWAPILLAPALTGLVALVVSDPNPEGVGMARAAASVSALRYVAPNLAAFTVHWVLALPLAIPLLLLRTRAIARWWWIGALGGALLVPVFGVSARGVALGAIAGAGIAVLWAIGAEAWMRRDPVQLALGGGLLISLATLPYPHLPSKYLLASAPAAAILVARATSGISWRRITFVVAITCALGVALGVAILRADAVFAGLGRRAASELIAARVAAGHRVWFAARWGFQWYAEKAGGLPLTLTPPHPASGDLLVTSERIPAADPVVQLLVKKFPRTRRLQVLEDREPGGRIMDETAGAGFFSQGWGYLPWAWGHEPVDTFELFRLE